jgi:hypothetical protein
MIQPQSAETFYLNFSSFFKLVIMVSKKQLLATLSQNLLENLNNEEYYDIIIEAGNSPDVEIFRAHKVILNCRSPYLRRILSTNEKKDDETLVHIKLPNILPKIFQVILR